MLINFRYEQKYLPKVSCSNFFHDPIFSHYDGLDSHKGSQDCYHDGQDIHQGSQNRNSMPNFIGFKSVVQGI